MMKSRIVEIDFEFQVFPNLMEYWTYQTHEIQLHFARNESMSAHFQKHGDVPYYYYFFYLD